MDFRRIFGTISLENVFVVKPKLGLEYLSPDESGSLEIFTTDSGKDKEQNVRNEFPLEVLLFFFVNCTKKLRFTHICTEITREERKKRDKGRERKENLYGDANTYKYGCSSVVSQFMANHSFFFFLSFFLSPSAPSFDE